jgi:Putative beta-lactamase-inhibitor-like, PepSY-like
MKQIIIFLGICAITISTNAQHLKSSDVPSAVKDKFASMYPNVTSAKWEKENGKYEAEFKERGVETSILFEANGTYTQTEVEIPVSSLPVGVKDYVSKNLRDSKINEASKITSANGTVTYEAEIGKSDYIFDANGNFLSKETDTNDNEDDDK